MRNKKTIIIILIILLAIWGAEAIRSFIKHGTILIGNGWQPTPEEAIEYKIEYLYDRQWEEKKGSFEIRQMIDTIELESELYYIFVSKANTVTVLNLIYDDDKEKWYCYDPVGFRYDENVEVLPHEGSLLNLCDTDLVYYFYSEDNHYAFALVGEGLVRNFRFNDIKADVRKYTFEENGKTYSFDFFYTDDIPINTKREDIDMYWEEN